MTTSFSVPLVECALVKHKKGWEVISDIHYSTNNVMYPPTLNCNTIGLWDARLECIRYIKMFVGLGQSRQSITNYPLISAECNKLII